MADREHLNILFLMENFLPHIGGTRIYYHHLLKTLPCKITVITRQHPESEVFDATQDFDIIRIPFGENKFLRPFRLQELSKYRAMFSAARREIKRQDFDFILCDLPAICGTVAWVLRFFYRVPFGVFSHDEAFQSNRRLIPKLEKLVLNAADFIGCSSDYARNKLISGNVAGDKITTIFPGLDKDQFIQSSAEALRREWQLEGRKILLTVARLETHKGQDRVIRAMVKVIDKHPDAIYLIGGKGSAEEGLRELVSKLGLDNHVRFLGYVAGDKANECLMLADLVLLLSCPGPGGKILEGFGIANIEASALGKPVITGNIGGTDQSVIDGETGFRVDPDNEDELTMRIMQLLDDQALAQTIGERGRKFVMEKFRAEDKASELHQLLLKLKSQ
ncbi:glycosyltransferase family 4 protein [Planctomycetota bacterium]